MRTSPHHQNSPISFSSSCSTSSSSTSSSKKIRENRTKHETEHFNKPQQEQKQQQQIQPQQQLQTQPQQQQPPQQLLSYPSCLSELTLDPEDFPQLSAGILNCDHPGFQDPVYRLRRTEIADMAFKYREWGTPIPRLEYTAEEKDTWTTIFTEIEEKRLGRICNEFQVVFKNLKKKCGFVAGNIPQLQDVSAFLQQESNFILKPVPGLLSPRKFLNGLAFRCFHATQYVRHHSNPRFSPEPDVVHELLGHIAMLANPDFADFSQQLGLASLGASDETIEMIAACYWFTLEFGLLRQDGTIKAYGAALVSSDGELSNALSGKVALIDFDPEVCVRTAYPVTELQPRYFVVDGFKEMTRIMKDFSKKMNHTEFIFNPQNRSVRVASTHNKAKNFDSTHFILNPLPIAT